MKSGVNAVKGSPRKSSELTAILKTLKAFQKDLESLKKISNLSKRSWISQKDLESLKKISNLSKRSQISQKDLKSLKKDLKSLKKDLKSLKNLKSLNKISNISSDH